MSPTPSGRSKRGFASMDHEKQRSIASKGGESVPAEKRSFSQNRQLAAEAGRKGGERRGMRQREEQAAASANGAAATEPSTGPAEDKGRKS